jgi:hypothetical protein
MRRFEASAPVAETDTPVASGTNHTSNAHHQRMSVSVVACPRNQDDKKR